MKLDVFNHVFPEIFIETLEETMPRRAVARWRSIETLWNMDARLRLLDGVRRLPADRLDVAAADRRARRP